MKIGEKVFDQDGKLITKTTYDLAPLLNDVKTLRHKREAGGPQICDGEHVARIPLSLVQEEARKRGIKWDDAQAMNDLVASLLMDRDFSQFRVWGGQL